MREQFSVRLKLLAWSCHAMVLAALCLGLLVATMVGFALIVLWVGIPWTLMSLPALRAIAGIHRRRAASLLGRDIPAPYLRPATGGPVLRLRARLMDPATWRDLAWLALNGTAGLAISIVSLAEMVLDLVFWWLPAGTMLRVHAYLAAALLSPNERTTLAQRVQDLADSRAAAAESSAAELRRIERDLHDGAQARLVAVGIHLSLAADALESDPAGAKQLILEARDATGTALGELRDLVHGILPPVLAERGLVGAIQELCLAAPVPVEVHAGEPVRLAAPVESAAYFSVAEVLANLIKHAHASAGSIVLESGIEALRIEVSDNGGGGACLVPGGGLDGVRRRLAAFDGSLSVSSPAGGPTTVTIIVPR